MFLTVCVNGAIIVLKHVTTIHYFTIVTCSASSELERIGNGALMQRALRTVREIGNECFLWCGSLCRVIFGVSSSLRGIGDGAFQETKLREMSMPESLREGTSFAFTS